MANNATFIVYHRIPVGHQESYESWLRKIIDEAARFRGHLGVNTVQPAPGGEHYSIAVKFSSDEDALAWKHSDNRKVLLEEAQPFLAEPERVAVSTGIDNWFQPDSPTPFQPKRYKQWLLTTLVIWVLTMLIPEILNYVVTVMPILNVYGIRHLLTAGATVGLVVYVIMPPLSRALSYWLQR